MLIDKPKKLLIRTNRVYSSSEFIYPANTELQVIDYGLSPYFHHNESGRILLIWKDDCIIINEQITNTEI